jgi:hypothetical protein
VLSGMHINKRTIEGTASTVSYSLKRILWVPGVIILEGKNYFGHAQ